MKEKNFGDKINTNGLDKNKHNINKKGQPRKGISYLSKEIQDKVGKSPTKKQIEDIVIGMLELTEDELQTIVKDTESAMSIKIIAKELLDDNKNFSAFNVLLDRGIGKAMPKDNDGEDRQVQFIIS